MHEEHEKELRKSYYKGKLIRWVNHVLQQGTTTFRHDDEEDGDVMIDDDAGELALKIMTLPPSNTPSENM